MEVILDGKVHVDTILNDRSQIIGIWHAIWEKLGLPLLADCTIMMESANQLCNNSLGLLQDLKINVASQHLFVQAQVC